jgi:hypothetical protein
MKVYLAGMESAERGNVITKGWIDNAFYSYYYMRDKDTPVTLVNGRPHIKSIILDSGAHSFFAEVLSSKVSASVHVKKTKTKETPDVYFANYVRWLKKWMHLIDYYVELDIGEIVGQSKVLEWREILKKEGLYHKCITVYYPAVMTWEDYLATLDDSQSKYVALESDRAGRARLDYNKIIKPAYDKKIKVHGFAFLKREGLLKFPFYSVDGSSWLTGTQWGASMVAVGNEIKNVRFIQESEELFSLSKAVTDLIDVVSSNLKLQREKRLELAILGYKAMERFYTELWRSRGIIWE